LRCNHAIGFFRLTVDDFITIQERNFPVEMQMLLRNIFICLRIGLVVNNFQGIQQMCGKGEVACLKVGQDVVP